MPLISTSPFAEMPSTSNGPPNYPLFNTARPSTSSSGHQPPSFSTVLAAAAQLVHRVKSGFKSKAVKSLLKRRSGIAKYVIDDELVQRPDFKNVNERFAANKCTGCFRAFLHRKNLIRHSMVCKRLELSNFANGEPVKSQPGFEHDELTESDSDDEDSEDEDSEDALSDDEDSAVSLPRATCPYCDRSFRKDYLSQQKLFTCKANVNMEGAFY